MIKFILMIWYKTTRNIFLFLLTLFVISILYLLLTNGISERHNDKIALEFYHLIQSNPQEVEKMIKISENQNNALKYLVNYKKEDIIKENRVDLFRDCIDYFPNFVKDNFRSYRTSIGSGKFVLNMKKNKQYRFLDKLGCGEDLVFYKDDPNYKDKQCLDDNCEDVIIRKVTDNWYWQKHCL